MRTELFDFNLPDELVALRPVVPRDAARLLVVRGNGGTEHRQFADLPAILEKNDILSFNDSRVIPARLQASRPSRLFGASDVEIEITLHKREGAGRFHAFVKPAKRLKVGDILHFRQGLQAELVARAGGEVVLAFNREGAALDGAIAVIGEMPLPPYIAKKRAPDAQDLQDYQTVYADREGSVAAPTAGLHFTQDLLARLEARGIAFAKTTLHVGAGTFLPVSAVDTEDHVMHAERAIMDAGTASRLNDVRKAGGRIVAVGTTALRILESAADENGHLQAIDRDTSIFITPGYRFRAVDALITNFHLPCSTLFMLVSAFMGLEVMQRAYAEAIREKYRFYSYGDACLLLRPAHD